MKKLLFISFILFLFIRATGQNWAPISEHTKSVFLSSELPSELACFSIDSINNSIADSTIYYNYQLYGENYDDSSDYSPCVGFGPSCELIQNKMSWFGRAIIQTGNEWHFTNKNSEDLKFNFSTPDTSIIFQNQNNALKLIYLNASISNLWGTIDSIKTYKLLHYDANGLLTTDALNNKTIRLSKHFGLLDFIDIKNYPDSLHLYSAIGAHNNTDSIGKVVIKAYEEHLSLPGTITQFEHKRESYSTCCPTFHEGYYKLSTYHTQSSYFLNGNYISEYTLNDSINDSIVIDTNIVGYTIPFVRNLDNQRIRITYDSTECYGKGLVIKTNYIDCEEFCSTYNCYSSNEPTNNAYCTEYYIIKHPNIRAIQTLIRHNNPNPFPPHPETNFIYSYVDGNSCGHRAYTSLDYGKKNDFKIYPTLAVESINIEGPIQTIKKIRIKDAKGRLHHEEFQSFSVLDISHLTVGVYFLEIHTDQNIETQRFIKQ